MLHDKALVSHFLDAEAKSKPNLIATASVLRSLLQDRIETCCLTDCYLILNLIKERELTYINICGSLHLWMSAFTDLRKTFNDICAILMLLSKFTFIGGGDHECDISILPIRTEKNRFYAGIVPRFNDVEIDILKSLIQGSQREFNASISKINISVVAPPAKPKDMSLSDYFNQDSSSPMIDISITLPKTNTNNNNNNNNNNTKNVINSDNAMDVTWI
jgi:hypothetical protein